MALASTTVSVGSSAAAIVTPTTATVNDPVPVMIFNNDSTNSIYLGGSNVTTANGYPVKAQSQVSLRLLNSDTIFAVANPTVSDVRILLGRQ